MLRAPMFPCDSIELTGITVKKNLAIGWLTLCLSQPYFSDMKSNVQTKLF